MLILIAPSKTYHQLNEIWTGNTESSLTHMGIEDARALEKISVDRAYVATARHMQEFANIVLKNPEYSIIAELTDRSMGTLTGRDYRETMAEFPRRNWLAWHRSFWTAPPEGQSFFDMSDRILTALRTKILPISALDRVAIIAAPDVLRVIIGYLSTIEEDEVPKIRIESCMPHVLNGDLS